MSESRTDPVAALRAFADGLESGDAELLQADLPRMRIGEDSLEIRLRWDR